MNGTACEALKPADVAYRDNNAYDVIGALLGADVVQRLRALRFSPLDVRNALLHRGEFSGDDFRRIQSMATFRDPSFDETWRVTWRTAAETLIAWLGRNGTLQLRPRRKR